MRTKPPKRNTSQDALKKTPKKGNRLVTIDEKASIVSLKNVDMSLISTVDEKTKPTPSKMTIKLENELKTLVIAKDLSDVKSSPNTPKGRAFDIVLKRMFRSQLLKQHETSPKSPTRPKLLRLNTFQLNSLLTFRPDAVKFVIDTTLREVMGKWEYSKSGAVTKAREVSKRIMRRVGRFHFDRYKILVMAQIFKREGQGINTGFRNLWDSQRDYHISSSLSRSSFMISVTVWGIYID